MEVGSCINKLLNCTHDSLFKLTLKREVKGTNLHALLIECDHRYVVMQEHFAIKLLE